MYSMAYSWESPAKSKPDILRSILNSIAKRIGRFRFSSQDTNNTNNRISKLSVFNQAESSLTEISPELKSTIIRMCIKAATKLTASQRNILEKPIRYGMEYGQDLTESPRRKDFVDSL